MKTLYTKMSYFDRYFRSNFDVVYYNEQSCTKIHQNQEFKTKYGTILLKIFTKAKKLMGIFLDIGLTRNNVSENNTKRIILDSMIT